MRKKIIIIKFFRPLTSPLISLKIMHRRAGLTFWSGNWKKSWMSPFYYKITHYKYMKSCKSKMDRPKNLNLSNVTGKSYFYGPAFYWSKILAPLKLQSSKIILNFETWQDWILEILFSSKILSSFNSRSRSFEMRSSSYFMVETKWNCETKLLNNSYEK